MSKIYFFKERVPIRKRKQEFLSLTLIGIIGLTTLFYFYYIEPLPKVPTNIPAIYIVCDDEITDENYVPCKVDLNDETLDALIKIRGSTGPNRAKKGYRLDLSKPKSLFGMRIDNDWTLFSLYKDRTRMNMKLSMDLWRSLESENPSAILPASKHIRLYLNGKFQGLYLLAEKNDRKLFELDKFQKNVDTSFIIQAKYNTFLREYDKTLWEQDYPDIENIDLLNRIIPDLIFFINNSSDNEFFHPSTGIYSKFDKLNLVDFFIYNFFILHKDFWSMNYFIIRDTYPSILYLIPWDFDGSLGSWGSQVYSSQENPEQEISVKNRLFDRLLNNSGFQQDCKARWEYLRTELWTEDFILEMLSKIYEQIKDILLIELTMWNKNKVNEKDFDIDEYIQYLFNWIPERLDFCDYYFSIF